MPCSRAPRPPPLPPRRPPQKLPRVDVGCLEEVIVKMEQDEKGEWADVLFIPPGSLAGAQGGGAQQQPEGAKSKGK